MKSKREIKNDKLILKILKQAGIVSNSKFDNPHYQLGMINTYLNILKILEKYKI